ncbi:MAG: hypothetical protein KDC05_06555 [Bacteroidales bacterium]|nr:hypothetical protein [Bacteroidales bacterium]
MKNLRLLSIVLAFFFTANLSAQNVSISDVSHTADPSAVLDVYSTSLGMLVPRLSSAPSSPAKGLFYYNTTSNSFFYNAGTSGSPSWTELSHGSLWSRTGTDTYLSNLTDNLVIGTTTSAPGYKFYVFGSTSQMSRFDGQVEFWDIAGGSMSADINDDGAGNGVITGYNSGGTSKVKFRTSGHSYLTGGRLGVGTTGPSSLLHVFDASGAGNPQLTIENPTGAGFASQTYLGSGIGAYSEGQVLSDNTYILNNAGSLAPGSQSDGTTMMKAYPNGIVDFDNQSRARAFQKQNPMLPGGMGQIIPPAIWTPIDFDMISYDEHGEFTPAITPPYSGGGGPAAAFFTATEEGYYQVNARTNFLLVDPEMFEPITTPLVPGFVTIAIVKTDVAGSTYIYAQGNKLQGSDNNMGPNTDLPNNLAPNVSDVVYLKAGETIEIWAWQDLWPMGLPLETGPRFDPGFGLPVPMQSQTYVSIHKSS